MKIVQEKIDIVFAPEEQKRDKSEWIIRFEGKKEALAMANILGDLISKTQETHPVEDKHEPDCEICKELDFRVRIQKERTIFMAEIQKHIEKYHK